MKTRRNLLFYLMFFILSLKSFAQDPSVKVVGIGNGLNESESVNAALRNCIEKTYGVFINISSEVENDQLVKDKISSVAQGSIKSYKIIESLDGGKQVTISAELSPSKVVEIVKAQGYKIELKGSVYAQNALIEEYYKKQESEIIKDFINRCSNINYFDFKYTVTEPRSAKGMSFREIDDDKIIQAIESNYDHLAAQCSLKKKDFFPSLPSSIAKRMPWMTCFPYLGKEKFAGNIFFNFKGGFQPMGGWPPSSELMVKMQKENIQFIQILCTPSFNKNYISSIESLIKLLNAINISDVKGFEIASGQPYSVILGNLNPFILGVDNQVFYLRNPASIRLISHFFDRVYFSSTCINLSSQTFDQASEVIAELPSFHYYNLLKGERMTETKEVSGKYSLPYSGGAAIKIDPFARTFRYTNNVVDSKYIVTFVPSRLILFYDMDGLSKLSEIKLQSRNGLFEIEY
jgi:hypothetical protein